MSFIHSHSSMSNDRPKMDNSEKRTEVFGVREINWVCIDSIHWLQPDLCKLRVLYMWRSSPNSFL